jgi:hypothetical protein
MDVKCCEDPRKGFGVFAAKAIPKGLFICELTGEYKMHKQWKNLGDVEFVYRFDLKNVSFTIIKL